MINNLPKKYHFSHDYALFLHDILAAIIRKESPLMCSRTR